MPRIRADKGMSLLGLVLAEMDWDDIPPGLFKYTDTVCGCDSKEMARTMNLTATCDSLDEFIREMIHGKRGLISCKPSSSVC